MDSLDSPYLNSVQSSLGDSSKKLVSKQNARTGDATIQEGRSKVAIQKCPLKRKKKNTRFKS